MSMTFQFDNFAQLIFMDGHGGFVWSSVLLTSFLLLSLVLNPILKRRKVLKKLKIEFMDSDNASY